MNEVMYGIMYHLIVLKNGRMIDNTFPCKSDLEKYLNREQPEVFYIILGRFCDWTAEEIVRKEYRVDQPI